MGILMSHPRQPQWKTAKTIFPWHESLWVFVFAFLAIHVVSLVVDEYAGVGIGGALVPGLSEYRSVPVAIGVIGLYALVLTVITARFTKLLPNGWWLRTSIGFPPSCWPWPGCTASWPAPIPMRFVRSTGWWPSQCWPA